MYLVLIVFICLVAVVYALTKKYLAGEKEIYFDETRFTKEMFPLQLILISDKLRIDGDIESIAAGAQTINIQTKFNFFKPKVIVRKTEEPRDPRNIYIYIENMKSHVRNHQNFDGSFGALAHSEINGNAVCFDHDENWSRSMMHIVTIHELLHSLGLGHSKKSDSIMQKKFKWQFSLGKSDLNNLKIRFPFIEFVI